MLVKSARLRRQGDLMFSDDNWSVEKIYARADEIDIPIALTVNYTTMEDHTMTIRDRHTV